MISCFPDENAGALKRHLGKVGLTNGKADTRMTGLSQGYRSCVLFAKITYFCPHLLIMDEPTNFLDIETVDALISACNKYSGALLLVSHNRQFLKKCAKTYLSIVPGKFDFFDDLKAAENATYSFIAEMEAGGDIDLKTAITSFADTNSGHGMKKEEEEDDTPKTAANYTFGAAKNTAKKDKPISKKFKVGDEVKAVYKPEKKFYPATVKKVHENGEKYTVEYKGYNETAVVASKYVKANKK
jgi:ABC-type multidrug transport system ATPase subunit